MEENRTQRRGCADLLMQQALTSSWGHGRTSIEPSSGPGRGVVKPAIVRGTASCAAVCTRAPSSAWPYRDRYAYLRRCSVSLACAKCASTERRLRPRPQPPLQRVDAVSGWGGGGQNWRDGDFRSLRSYSIAVNGRLRKSRSRRPVAPLTPCLTLPASTPFTSAPCLLQCSVASTPGCRNYVASVSGLRDLDHRRPQENGLRRILRQRPRGCPADRLWGHAAGGQHGRDLVHDAARCSTGRFSVTSCRAARRVAAGTDAVSLLSCLQAARGLACAGRPPQPASFVAAAAAASPAALIAGSLVIRALPRSASASSCLFPRGTRYGGPEALLLQPHFQSRSCCLGGAVAAAVPRPPSIAARPIRRAAAPHWLRRQ
jgi:hypothetical protein